MPGIGVLANVAAVALGGILGLGCGRLITERFQNTIMRACALAVLFLGLGGALREMLRIGADGHLAFAGAMTGSISPKCTGCPPTALCSEYSKTKSPMTSGTGAGF